MNSTMNASASLHNVDVKRVFVSNKSAGFPSYSLKLSASLLVVVVPFVVPVVPSFVSVLFAVDDVAEVVPFVNFCDVVPFDVCDVSPVAVVFPLVLILPVSLTLYLYVKYSQTKIANDLHSFNGLNVVVDILHLYAVGFKIVAQIFCHFSC